MSVYGYVVGTSALILFAAVVPALCYAALIVRLDRYEREPRHVLLATFLWGAVIAALASSAANSGVHAWVARLAGEGSARALTPVLLAPAIEEIAKAGGLLLVLVAWPRELDNVLDGIVYGALVGVGFAMTENVTYFTLAAVQGGAAGFAQSVYLRALVGGLNHAAFSATIGAGLGYARETRSTAVRILAPIFGFLGAVGQHVAWNAVTSTRLTDLLCSPAVPGGACREAPDPITLFLTVPLLVAVSVGPGVIALLVVAILALRREARVIALELRDEVGGLITADEYARLTSARARRAAEWQALRRRGLRVWRAQRQFHQTATELAFRRWHLRRQQGVRRDTSEEEYRARLATLRHCLDLPPGADVRHGRGR